MPDFPADDNPTDYVSLTSDELIARLREAEETLEVIRAGEAEMP